MTTSTFEVGDLFVSVNPVSGSTTVLYDTGKTSLSAIEAAIVC